MTSHAQRRQNEDRRRQSKDETMNKMALILSLALSGAMAFSAAHAGTGKATTLMVRELPDLPGKEGMVEVVDFAPGEVSHRNRQKENFLVYVGGGSVHTQ